MSRGKIVLWAALITVVSYAVFAGLAAVAAIVMPANLALQLALVVPLALLLFPVISIGLLRRFTGGRPSSPRIFVAALVALFVLVQAVIAMLIYFGVTTPTEGLIVWCVAMVFGNAFVLKRFWTG